MKAQLFKPGNIVFAYAAREYLTNRDVFRLLKRHVTGDFGKVSGTAWEDNLEAIRGNNSICSVYEIEGRAYMLLTDWSRENTFIFMVKEDEF